MKKWLVMLCVWCLLGCSLVYTNAEEQAGQVSGTEEMAESVTIKEGELFSQGAVLMDASSGRVLYGKIRICSLLWQVQRKS